MEDPRRSRPPPDPPQGRTAMMRLSARWLSSLCLCLLATAPTLGVDADITGTAPAKGRSTSAATSGRSSPINASHVTAPTLASARRACGSTRPKGRRRPSSRAIGRSSPASPSRASWSRESTRPTPTRSCLRRSTRSRSRRPRSAKLKQWVAEGGSYKQHWAFIAPKRPACRRCPPRRVGPQPDRRLRPGAAGKGRAEALARGRPRDLAAAR